MSKNPYETTAAIIYDIVEESPTHPNLRLRPEQPIPFKTGQFMEVTVPGIGEGPFTLTKVSAFQSDRSPSR